MAKQFHCELVPLERVYALAFELSRRIRDAGFEPDWIVAVARGGFVPARLLCDFLNVSAMASIGVRHYEAGARKQERALLSVPLAADVRGRRVLVVDDVNDSGETLVVAKEHLRELGAAQVRFAVLHEKSRTRLSADFCAERMPAGIWCLYQWALVEDVTGFLSRMEPRPATREEARHRFAEDYDLALDAQTWERIERCMRVLSR